MRTANKSGRVKNSIRRQQFRRTMVLECLEERRVLAADYTNVAQVGTIVSKFNAAIESGTVLGASIPVVGNQLANSTAADFFQNLSTELSTQLAGDASSADVITSIQTALTNLGVAGASVTSAADAPSNGERFTIDIDHMIAGQSVTLSTGLGAAFLGSGLFTAGGTISASLRYDFKFDFVVADDAAVFVDTSTETFALIVGADLTGFSAEADLGVLKMTVANHPTDPTTVSASFGVDLVSAGDQLTPAGTVTADATFTADIDINLRLTTDLTKYDFGGLSLFPSLVADLHVDWTFTGQSTTNLSAAPAPTVGFDLYLDTGSFFSNFVDPVLEPIRKIIEPLRPVVNVFTTPIPGFNDVGLVRDELDGALGNGDGVANLLDFVTVLSGGDSISDFISAIQKFDEMITLRDQQIAAGSIDAEFLPLGSFTFTVDLRNSASPSDFDFDTSTGVSASPIADPVAGVTDSDTAAFFQSLSGLNENGGGFSFNLVENPIEAFKLLLDQDATLFTWALPTVDFQPSPVGIDIPVFPLVNVGGEIGLDVAINLAFGYDTRGLRSFFNGGDVADVIFGGLWLPTDQAIVTLFPSIALFARVGQGLIAEASAGIDAGTDGVKFLLADPSPADNNNRVYLDELGQSILDNFACIFVITGTLEAYLEAELKVGVEYDWVSLTKTIAKERFVRVPIVDFNFACDNGSNPVDTAALAGTLATKMPDGSLRLNIGPFASARGAFNQIDGNEEYVVTHLEGEAGNEKIEVKAFGLTAVYEGVHHVYGNAGVGDDKVTLVGVLSTASISGDIGNDELRAGPLADPPDSVNGAVLLDGGDGNDILTGGTSGDVLRGGSGNDNIHGSGGDDDIDGGSGDDEIYADAGNDFVVAGHGRDIIDGGEGDDHLYGDEGNDQISAGKGNDEVYGGDDDDALFGNEGNDYVVGGGGSDTIVWSHFVGAMPAESIVDGDDIIDGAEGTDRVVVQTSSEAEEFLVESLGSNVFVRRTAGGNFVLNLISVELLGMNLGAGADKITVLDTAGTDLQVIQVNVGTVDTGSTGYTSVADYLNSATISPDTQNDSVIVKAGPTNDDVTVAKLNQAGQDYVEVTGLAPRIQLFDSNAAHDSLEVQGGAGDDSIKAFPLVETSFKITLSGNDGDDYLSADAILNGGAGNDTLEGLPNSVDTFNGGAGFDTVLVRGTPGNDTILVTQSSASALQVSVNGVVDNETVNEMEAVRIEGEEGADIFAISVADALAGSLAFRLYGGAGNDRAVVRDEGTGDLVVHRLGRDGVSGSIIVGSLAAIDYEHLELVNITPLDGVNGGTGAAFDGRLLVIPPDPFESNETRFIATPLGGEPVFIGNLSIEPGGISLPGPFNSVGADQDWFEFRATKIGTFRFEALFEQISNVASGRPGLPNNGNLDIAVFSENGTLIAQSTGAGDNASVDISLATGKRYFARVIGADTAINVYDLKISEVDLIGPIITDVYITSAPTFDLFAVKPADEGPTPGIKSLTIEVEDAVPRAPGDLYAALVAAIAQNEGNFFVRGDHNGLIAVQAVTVLNVAPVVGQTAKATITLTFADFLPDDRYTFTISSALTDPAGNGLDGNSNASTPEAIVFPSGDGVPGGNFVSRFTVDSRPEVAVFSQGAVAVDLNSNFRFDTLGSAIDSAHRDVVFQIGTISDHVFAGKFEPALLNLNDNDGFDKLGAYGYDNVAREYRFLLDLNHDGLFDTRIRSQYQINAVPVAGDFAPGRAGDEIGLFDGTHWYLDTNGDNQLDTVIATAMRGLPIVGDFNGDGKDDLAVYDNAPNTFQFDLDRNGTVDDSFTIDQLNPAGSDNGNGIDNGFNERPFTGDWNLDGVDDLGLSVPTREGSSTPGLGEWFLLVSDRSGGLPRQNFNGFAPSPLGNDLAASFGSSGTLPLFGNFDPPVGEVATQNDVFDQTPYLSQNSSNRYDANGDGVITPLDALQIVIALNAGQGNSIPVAGQSMIHLDVSGDSVLTPLDALMVIIELNSGGQSQPESIGTDVPAGDAGAGSGVFYDPQLVDYFFSEEESQEESEEALALGY